MRVLFTTPVLEHPAAGGPQLRIENSILALNRVSELFVVSRIERSMLGGKGAEQFFRQHCREFAYTPAWAGLSENRYLRKFQRLLTVFLADDAKFLLEYVDSRNIDVIWFGYGNISYDLIKKIKARRPGIKVVCDTDSVWSRFVLRELPYENDPRRRKNIALTGKLKEQEEKEWVNLCDVTTAVSEVDADYYRDLAVSPDRIKLFSNVINLDTYSVDSPPPDGFESPCFYLAGTFGPDSPMDKAARWVISEVLPIIRGKIPDIHFYIVGRDSDKTLRDISDPGITITGKLVSVLPYLCNAAVSIVPLTFESGTRFKILEAAACGIPIVSTTLGAEGIPVINGEHVVVADDAESFAIGICRIVQDRAFGALIAENSRQLIKKSYSIDTLVHEAEDIIEFLKAENTGGAAALSRRYSAGYI